MTPLSITDDTIDDDFSKNSGNSVKTREFSKNTGKRGPGPCTRGTTRVRTVAPPITHPGTHHCPAAAHDRLSRHHTRLSRHDEFTRLLLVTTYRACTPLVPLFGVLSLIY